ncbi:hypothetical protein [Priestia endophytica]|uniref:hypothetical protein n=1 Tax=Priestia endophytica TaxID=135735 RepID=UPI00227DF929|nr:hypothetical protein [Priestia endophytica]MCY8235275.1 hypothetical protein [Priestia endophytica]
MARQEIDVKNQDQEQTVRIKDSHNVKIYHTEEQRLMIVQILKAMSNGAFPKQNNEKSIKGLLKIKKNKLQRELHDIENDLMKQRENITVENSSDITIIQCVIQDDQLKEIAETLVKAKTPK